MKTLSTLFSHSSIQVRILSLGSSAAVLAMGTLMGLLVSGTGTHTGTI